MKKNIKKIRRRIKIISTKEVIQEVVEFKLSEKEAAALLILIGPMSDQKMKDIFKESYNYKKVKEKYKFSDQSLCDLLGEMHQTFDGQHFNLALKH